MCALQRRDQVRRVPAAGRRARDRPRRHRPLRTLRRRRRPPPPAAGRRPGEGPELHAAHARAAGARPVALPGRRPREERGRAHSRRASVCRSPRSPTRRSSASLRRATPAGSCAPGRPSLVRDGGEVVDVRRSRAGRARRDVRVHRGAAAGARRGDRLPRVRAGGRSPPRTVSWSGRRSCCASAGSSPTVSRGWPAPRRPTARSRPRSGLRYSRRGRAGDGHPRRTERSSVAFGSPQRAVAPGQSVVVYRGEELLGGGRIVARHRLMRGVGARTGSSATPTMLAA